MVIIGQGMYTVVVSVCKLRTYCSLSGLPKSHCSKRSCHISMLLLDLQCDGNWVLRKESMPLTDLPHHLLQLCFSGNHEYYTGDVDSWIQELPKLNVTPLVNERVCLFSTGSQGNGCPGGLYLAGLEDIETRMRM